MKRFLCAAFFIALVALLAACGVLNKVSAPVQATAAPAQASTPATGDFPVLYLAGIVGLILICSAGLLMLRKI